MNKIASFVKVAITPEYLENVLNRATTNPALRRKAVLAKGRNVPDRYVGYTKRNRKRVIPASTTLLNREEGFPPDLQYNVKAFRREMPTIISNRPKKINELLSGWGGETVSSPKDKEMLSRLQKAHELHELKYVKRLKNEGTRSLATGMRPEHRMVEDTVGGHMHKRIIEREFRFSNKLKGRYPQVHKVQQAMRAAEVKMIDANNHSGQHLPQYKEVLNNTWLKDAK